MKCVVVAIVFLLAGCGGGQDFNKKVSGESITQYKTPSTMVIYGFEKLTNVVVFCDDYGNRVYMRASGNSAVTVVANDC